MEPSLSTNINQLQEDFDDFFENSLCGYLIADAQGFIMRANKKIAAWLNCTTDDFNKKRFSDLLAFGSKVYFETHLRPLLKLQGFFDEVVLDLSDANGQKLRVMVNGFERRDNIGQSFFIRYTILKASDRLEYEQNLHRTNALTEKELVKKTAIVALREQLIAVLGHDLRNPLSAIIIAVDLLISSPLGNNTLLLDTLKRSSYRMLELVDNIMDFARTRLGVGIVLNRQSSLLEPVLAQVVAEIMLIHPKREIRAIFNIKEPINCDASRLAQLLSNLLSNALTHGYPNSPIVVRATQNDENLELSVTNNGNKIPAVLQERLFDPFTRETDRSNQNGLGLGLFICSEISKAHNGTLSFTSSATETSFIFRMSV